MHGCERFIPPMIQRGADGHVVNVASAAGYLAMPVMCAYSTTKFAVFGLTEALRIELRKHKIGVTATCPGAINTPITSTSIARGADADGRAARTRAFYQRHGYKPERAAADILRAVGRNRAIVPVAPVAYLMFAFTRVSPAAARRLAAFMFTFYK